MDNFVIVLSYILHVENKLAKVDNIYGPMDDEEWF